MAYAMSLTNALGLAAGVAILLVGLFVLLARPRATVNRAFFVLALFDGMSSLLFELREMTTLPSLKVYYMATFYYFFVAFLVALVCFGLLFPRPLGGPRMRPLLFGAPVALGLVTLVAFARDHGLFYEVVQVGSGYAYRRTDVGQLVEIAFPVAAAVVVVKLASDVFRDAFAPRRRQAALVLGGVALAYGGIFLGDVWLGLQIPQDTFFSSRPLLVVKYWLGYSGVVVLLAVLAFRLARAKGPEAEHRRFLLGCLAGAVALALVAQATASAYALVQILSLLVYPMLLAYAIVSAEAFSINPQLRRATMLTLGGAGIAGIFIVAENFLEGYLSKNLFGFLSSQTVAGILSALLAAALAIPMLRLATRIVNRVAPDLSQDVRYTKNLALYRLVLEGALADGMLDARESKALDALRAGLGISEREHAEMTDAVRASAAAPVPHAGRLG